MLENLMQSPALLKFIENPVFSSLKAVIISTQVRAVSINCKGEHKVKQNEIKK